MLLTMVEYKGEKLLQVAYISIASALESTHHQYYLLVVDALGMPHVDIYTTVLGVLLPGKQDDEN